MRKKYILRSGEVASATILAIYFTPSKKNPKRGVLTIGGPKRFVDVVDEVLKGFFGIEEGIEDNRVKERQEDMERKRKRKRLVYDVKLSVRVFRNAVRDMKGAGIRVSRVSNTRRVLR